MARPKSPVVAARDHEIYSLWRRGTSLQELAAQFNISPRRVGQVVAAQHPEDDEDIDRSLYRGYLWRLFEEVRDLYRAPGYKMSPTGRVAENPDGEPAEDTGIKLQAAELELKVLESLRKLDARDKQMMKPMNTPDAERDMWAAIAAERQRKIEADRLSDAERRELAELRRLTGHVIPGEVLAELPPGGA